PRVPDPRRPAAAAARRHDLAAARRGPDAGMPGLAQLLDLLRAEEAAMRGDGRIVHAMASMRIEDVHECLFAGARLAAEQRFRFVEPNLEATAAVGGEFQTRTLGGRYNGFARQGGSEVIAAAGMPGAGARIAREAIELAQAPQCPDGVMDLLLMPDQMMLQIHESIGHPLELDRILGDERNFAGGSFVTLDMFGSYRYGAPGLHVSFDPGVPGELGGYACDDEGMPAERSFLIRDGWLLRPLGSALSVARAAALGYRFAPVANARASGWHRAPIDRMANLNVEPGDASLEQMVSEVERGVLMRTNASWSIDDQRDKFQFGCERGRMIEGGRLTHPVRNPVYRGRSATFWRSLARIGDRSGFEVHGTPFCGKGEPGQVVRVGHAAPPCLFRAVEVFGGES
ncbi:MAG: TldD/PmbA family protein, partial [Burkholderiales bacterium]